VGLEVNSLKKHVLLYATACLVACVNPGAAHAQDAAAEKPQASQGSPFLPHTHWSMAAARRLHAAGLTPEGFDPGSGVITIARMRDALAYASTHAETSPLKNVSSGLYARYTAEFGDGAADGSVAVLHAEGSAGVRERTGAVSVGRLTADGGWDPPMPTPDSHGAAAVLDFDVSIPHLALTSAMDVDRNVRFNTLALSASTHGWAAFGGRLAPGNRTTESGSVTVQGDVAFNGGGLFRTDPMHLPGFLRGIGPVGFETMLARAHGQPNVFEPWFWATRASIEPFSWMGLHATRGVYIGSLVEGEPLSAADVARVLIGQNARTSADDYADNQLVALDGWFRSPSHSVPLMFYWDWGSDDSSGAWWEVAGRVLGLRLAAVPSVPFLGVGVERVAFDPPGDDHGPFYRHDQFRAGWSEQRVLLGHPIGGNGRETAVYANASLLDSDLLVNARGYSGARGIWNVYAPTHAGRFKGADVSVDYSLNGNTRARAHWAREWGGSWSQSALEIGVGISR
jgi:hypothetical protein